MGMSAYSTDSTNESNLVFVKMEVTVTQWTTEDTRVVGRKTHFSFRLDIAYAVGLVSSKIIPPRIWKLFIAASLDRNLFL